MHYGTMKKQKISKLEEPIRVFGRVERWETVQSPEEEVAIYRAMDHPLRRTILDLLDEGPVRQIDLAKLIGKTTGRRCDAAALLHHLEILEKAGLVSHVDLSGRKTKIKIIFRTRDIRLQAYERPKVEIRARGTETQR
jgi:DNA-binding transcriptional ArsR family regulator